MKIKPIGERVIIKQVKAEEKTKSGLYLPKGEDKKQGTIHEVGHLKDQIIKNGDKVIYSGYSHEEIEIDGEKYLIVELKDVIAIIE